MMEALPREIALPIAVVGDLAVQRYLFFHPNPKRKRGIVGNVEFSREFDPSLTLRVQIDLLECRRRDDWTTIGFVIDRLAVSDRI